MSDDAKTSPALRAAAIGIDVVEDVLLTLKQLPGRVDRRAIVASLERAAESLQLLQTSPLTSPDHLELLGASRTRVRTAAETIEGHDHNELSLKLATRLRGAERMLEMAREATIDVVVAMQGTLPDDLSQRSQERVPDVAPFAVSHGAPLLHTLERDLVRAHVDVTPEEHIWEEPLTRDEEDENVAEEERDEVLDLASTNEEAEPFDDRASDPAKRLPLLVANSVQTEATMVQGLEGEIAQLERLLRTCLEDVGAMGNLRRLREHEPFELEAIERFETRLCDCLDASMALGHGFQTASGNGARFGGIDVLDFAVRYARESITADPGRSFARTMLLGSVAGSDTVRAAVLALKESPPYTYRAHREAFSLAPNPAIVGAMNRLCKDDDWQLITLALDVLAMRGEVEFGAVTPLLDHPQQEVRTSAISALAVAQERDATVQLLVDICENEIDDDIWMAGVETLVKLRCSDGLNMLRERLVEEVEEDDADMLRADLRTRCMRLLGIAGKADDYLLLERLYFGDRGQAAALGFHGHVRMVDRLLLALEGSTQAGVYLGVSGRLEAAQALQRITGAPFVKPKEGGYVDPYDVVTDAKPWMSWWDDNRDQFDPSVRYRFGQPFTGLFRVHELLADQVRVRTRRVCALELEVLFGTSFPLHDFIAHQRVVLGQAQASIEAGMHGNHERFGPGRWLVLEA